jgi:TetR/AcrR family transcriptional regulator, transcriptional repressor for nem operon
MTKLDCQVQFCHAAEMPTQPPEPRPLTRRGAATRARIVDAAAKLTYAHGVDRTSLDDVMAESGVSKSQLYHYFADKDALISEVIAVQTERVLAAQQPHLAALDSLSALRSWRDAIVRLNDGIHARGCPLGSLANELVNDSEPARKQLAASFAVWSHCIEQGLALMHQRGELAASANPRELATALLCAVQGGLLLAKTARSSHPLRIALDMAIDHIAAHLAKVKSK